VVRSQEAGIGHRVTKGSEAGTFSADGVRIKRELTAARMLLA
jgi:hypothetical protein